MEPYYYQTLSKAEQSSYQAMQAGLQAFAPSFLYRFWKTER